MLLKNSQRNNLLYKWATCLLAFLSFFPCSSLGVLNDSLLVPGSHVHSDLMLGDETQLSAWSDRNCVISFTSHDGGDLNGLQHVSYYDSFGRPCEEVDEAFTPAENHLSFLTEYDYYGRKSHEWLPAIVPYSSPNLSVSDIQALSSSSNGNDGAPYISHSYLSCPYTVSTGHTGPGSVWHNGSKKIQEEYYVNKYAGSNSRFRCFHIVKTDSVYSVLGRYPDNRLKCIRRTDEDGRIEYTFTDLSGRTVLVRRIDSTSNYWYADTYYVYSPHGNLLAVLPPEISAHFYTGFTISASLLNRFGYLYEYDNRDRLVSKKLPGADCVYYRYDKGDTPVFTQDGRLRQGNKWAFTLSDVHGRPTVTGICRSPLPVIDTLYVNTLFTTQGTSLGGYTANITLKIETLQRVLYYDDYDFLSRIQATISEQLLPESREQYDSVYTVPALLPSQSSLPSRGFQTGCRTYRASGGTSYEVTAYYYGERGRMVQRKSTTHMGGIETEMFAYNFTGQVVRRLHSHVLQTGNTTPASILEEYSYSYDHADRLMAVLHSVNGSTPMSLASYTYDELGRIQSKTIGGTETVSYAYNVRSWPTLLSGSKFSEFLMYNTEVCPQSLPVNGTTLPQASRLYGGNIARAVWKRNDEYWSRYYTFHYDTMNRLSQSDYTCAVGPHENEEDTYSELYTYDLMGNMQTLTRHGINEVDNSGLVDALTMEYDGNHLVRVSDTVEGPYSSTIMHFQDASDEDDEYAYDANGNMTMDLNRGITNISYNYLNLPSSVYQSGGRRIDYSYSADGRKLSVLYLKNLPVDSIASPIPGNTLPAPALQPPFGQFESSVEYVGNFVYNGTTRLLQTEEGFVTFSTSGSPVYHFYLRDHLGSIRAVLNQRGMVDESYDYYPSGATYFVSQKGSSSENSRLLFCGKELDRMHGLDWYDSEARYLDVLYGARFTGMDPLAEESPEVSPYAYCRNNFVNRIDPDGKDDYYSYAGQFLFRDNKTTDNIIIRNEFLYHMKQISGAEWLQTDYPIQNVTLSAEAYSNIFTDVLSKMKDVDISDLHNEKVSVTVWRKSFNTNLDVEMADNSNDGNIEVLCNAGIGPYKNSDKQRLTVYIFPKGDEERELWATVSNIQNLLGVHEYFGHYKKGWSNHDAILSLQKKSPSWEKTSEFFKAYMNSIYEKR